MPTIPAKVAARLTASLKRFQPIITSAKSRDIGEADTVTIVTDMLSEVFGYDKYSEITSEYAIRGTFCDLATKLDGQLQALIEVKAISSDLKDAQVKQAVDYAANQGVDWVVLTNGACWRVYKISFTKPIDQELVIQIDICKLNPKVQQDLETLYLWCKEGWIRSVLGDFHAQKQALSRFHIGAMLLSDTVVDVIRRELRRSSPDIRIDNDQIRDVLIAEVLKREVTEGEKAEEAQKKLARTVAKAIKAKAKKQSQSEDDGETDSEPREPKRPKEPVGQLVGTRNVLRDEESPSDVAVKAKAR